MSASRPLVLTVEVDDGFDGDYYTEEFVLRCNGEAILREATKYTSDVDDAETWAIEKLRGLFGGAENVQ